MECPICYNLIKNSCVGSCMHHYCYNCIVKWLSTNPVCPICKMPAYELKLDREFDSINNSPTDENIEKITKTIVIDFKNNIPPGITITNNCNSPGVKVLDLKKSENCYIIGIRKDDIILFINSVPCNTHKHAIDIIEECYERRKQIIFELFI